MVFIRFQYPLQRHFVVLVVAGLVVDITIMQAPIAIHRFMFIPMVLQDLSVGLLQVPNKQWGTNTIGSRTTRTEAYPLPYSEFCLPIVSGKGYVGGLNYGFGVGVTNFGLTSVTIANNSEDSSYRWTGYTYIVVGAQPQWGYSNSTGVTFPIAFKECYAVVSNAHSNTTGNTDHYHLLSWTSTGAAFGYWNMSFYGTLYIALGVE